MTYLRQFGFEDGDEPSVLSRRQLLKGVVGATVGLSLNGGCFSPAPAEKASSHSQVSPHVVFIVLDALRAEALPMFGNPRNTAPFLQSLVPTSTLYTRCYSSATWTRPAVTGILYRAT